MALGNIHIFSVIQCILFKIFLQFSLPPPYTMLKFGKNSGYTRPTLFVGRGEGLGMSELENAQKCKSVPRLLPMILACIELNSINYAVLKVY